MISVWFNKTYVQVLCLIFVGSCYWHIFRLISYRKRMGLAGLLYFHPISNIQIPSIKSNYFKRLCQTELNRVTLTTTMWGGVDERTGTLHEDELKRLCKPLINEGMSVKQFLNNPSSAFHILHPIVRAVLSRQSTVGRALLVATTAIKSLRPISPPIIMYEKSNSSWFTDTYSWNRIVGTKACGKSQVWVLAIIVMDH